MHAKLVQIDTTDAAVDKAVSQEDKSNKNQKSNAWLILKSIKTKQQGLMSIQVFTIRYLTRGPASIFVSFVLF